MADTIITTPSRDDSGVGGWAVAVVILIVVIAAGIVWYRYYRTPAAPSSTNINVTLPVGSGDSGSAAQ